MMRTILLLFFLTTCWQIHSQDRWDLQRCLEFAIDNSIDIYQAELNIRNAGVSTKLSRAQLYPNLSFNTNVGWNFGRTVDPTTNDFITATFFANGYSLNTGILLYSGGLLRKTVEQNEWMEKASVADRDAAINLLSLNVIRAYFEILFARDSYENSSIQLKTINDQLDQMEKLVNAGSRAQYEIYDLEAQQASFEQEVTMAQNRIDLALLNLKGLLNLPSDYDMDIEEPPVDQPVYTDVDLANIDEVFTRALAFQPNARSLEHRINSAELGLDIAKTGYYPTVSFGGSVSTNYSNQAKEVAGFTSTQVASDALIDGNPAVISFEQTIPILNNSPYFNQIDNNFSYGFGFNVSMPIYSNWQTKADIERAKISLENLVSEQDQNAIDLKNSMMQLLTDARAARRTLDAAEKTLRAREVAFENAEKRYNLGAINSYEYIGIQDELNTARIDQIISKYDYMLKVKVLDYYQGYAVQLK